MGGKWKRREFIKLLGAAAAALPAPLHAQTGAGTRRIGVLMARLDTDTEAQRQAAALRQGLRDLGWKLGESLQFEFRWTVGDPGKALEHARELSALKPDLLVANATPSLIALREATNSIPIIFVSVADPVGQGFVPSLSRPGGKITGFSAEESRMGGKWLDYLKEIAPRTSRITIVYNPDTAPYAPMFFPAMRAAAPRMAVTLSIEPVRSAVDLERVIATAGERPDSGLIVLPDSSMFGLRSQIIALTAQHRLPAVYPTQIFVTDGGLLAYGIDRVDMFRRAASYVDRILKGAAPADLPVQQPIKFELGVNMKTAKSLGLSVPQSLLLSADDVIE